uniref:PRELI/MSF1 domain-containing protein n=1 Tax=Strigamia maritima TaxID=126957 RepID=T1J487_STRMM
MKIWTSEHTFNHPWETVTQAAWRKYPNPMNPSVIGIDVVDRKVNDGVLSTHRLICTKWGLPNWVNNLTGGDKNCYVSEMSQVDPYNRIMTMESKNVSLSKYVSVDEKLTYSPHPTNNDCTLLRQEAVVTVKGVPLKSYLEERVTNSISTNANKGRLAMEWVISMLNTEVHELTSSAVKSMDELTSSAKKSMDDLTNNTKKSMDDLTRAFKNVEGFTSPLSSSIPKL